MSRSTLERRLTDLGDRLARLRAELVVTDEQLVHLSGEADDTRLRALVSETPLAGKEHRTAQRHADAMTRHRAALCSRIETFERQQDELLEQFFAETNG